MASNDKAVPANDGTEKQNIVHHDGFSPAQDQAFTLLDQAKMTGGDKGRLSADQLKDLTSDIKQMSPEQYTAVVTAAFKDRKDEFNRLPGNMQSTFLEWVDHFAGKSNDPTVKAMNDQIRQTLQPHAA